MPAAARGHGGSCRLGHAFGNPANALYVFTGVGRSPLSTEVFAAVIFLALAGVYWLYSFAEHPRVGLQRGLLAAIDVAIVAFVSSVAFAYNWTPS